MSRRAARSDRDAGSATVWVLVAAGVLTAAAALSVALGSAALVRHRAAAVADAAALAAAAELPGVPGDACAAAARIATADRARLGGCNVAGADVRVTTRVSAPGWLAFAGTATGSACAEKISADPTEPTQARRRRNLAESTSLCQLTTPPG